jgi:hypothetical protein
MGAPRLERIAAELEAILMAMPAEDQQQTVDGIMQLVQATQSLKVLPPAVISRVWSILVTFVLTMQMPRMRMSKLVRQIFDGAPHLFPAQFRTQLLAEIAKDEDGTPPTEIASCHGLETKPAR